MNCAARIFLYFYKKNIRFTLFSVGLVASTLFFSTPSFASSYYFAPSDQCSGESTYNWIDAKTGGTKITTFSNQDDGVATVNLGFTFNYDGVLYTTARVYTNGFMAFDTSGTVNSYGSTIPSGGLSEAFLAPFWKDLNINTGQGVYYKVIGTAPNRKFVLQWDKISFYSSGGEHTFEIVLDEATGDIYFQYGAMTYASSAEKHIGIEYAGGAAGIQYDGYLPTDPATETPLALRFTTSTLTCATFTPVPTLTPTVTFTPTVTPTIDINFLNYTAYKSNECAAVPYNWVDITGDGDIWTFGGEYSTLLYPPISIFPFVYHGISYSELLVSSNGAISFDGNDPFPNSGFPEQIPTLMGSSGGSDNYIAPFLANMYGSGTLYYKLDGVAPNRRFIIEWFQVEPYNQSDQKKNTFELILEESTNDIIFQYGPMDFSTGLGASIGLEYAAGTDGVNYSYDTDNAVFDGLAVKFTASTLSCVAPTATETPTITETSTPTDTSTATDTPTSSSTPTDTSTATETPTITLTATPTVVFAGYTMQDLNSCPGGVNYNWIDTSVDGMPVTLNDDDSIEVVLPFTFTFAGVERSSVFISSNGFLSFSADGANSLNNIAIPNPTPPNEFIAALWYDLLPPAGGTIRYMVTNDSPRKFVVEWNNIPDIDEQSTQTFEIALEESTNSIQIQYQTVDPVIANASVAGVEYNSGTEGMQYPRVVNNGLALAFQLIPFTCDSTYTPTETATETETPTATATIPPPPNNPPLAWWRLDENGSSFADSTGNGHTANTIGNAYVIPGYIDDAQEIVDGNFICAEIPSLPSGSQPRTIESWFFPYGSYNVNLGSIFGYPFNDYNGGTNNWFEVKYSDDGDQHFGVHLWGTHLTSTNAFPDNNWYHLALSYDGNTLILYVNGVAEITESIVLSTEVNPSGCNFNVFGQISQSNDSARTGIIDDVRLYNYARSASQVADDMSFTNPWDLHPTATPTQTLTPTPLAYSYARSDTCPADSTYSWIDATAGTELTSFSNTNESDVAVPLPFTFNYGGVDYTTIYAGTNGTADFDNFHLGYDIFPIPSDMDSNSFLAPFWHDFDLAAGGQVFTITTGSELAHDRKFVIEWHQIKLYPDDQGITFELILDEATGDIIFQYNDVTFSNGLNAEIGIEYADGLAGNEVANSVPNAVSNGLALRFTQSVLSCDNSTFTPTETATATETLTPTATVNNPPLAWWRLDEDGSSFADSTGNGHTANTIGSLYSVPGHIDTAQQVINGNYICSEIPSLPSGSQPRTIEAWFVSYNDWNINTGSIFGYPFNDYNGGTNNWFEVTYSDNGDQRFGVHLWGTRFYSVDTFPVGQWHHLALSYDGSSLILYVDGIVEITESIVLSTEVNPTGCNFNVFGQINQSVDEARSGELDEVRLYNYARSQSQVADDMNFTNPWDLHPTATPTQTLTPTPLGYSYARSDTCPTDSTYSWIDATAGTELTPFPDMDESDVAVPLPFTFNYAGVDYSTIYAGTNGTADFDNFHNGYYVLPIPQNGDSDEFLAPFWHDFNLYSGGQVFTITTGSEFTHDRKLVIEWYQMKLSPSDQGVTFELILDEATGDIIFQYNDVAFNSGRDAEIGIEYSNGYKGVQVALGQDHAVQDGLALRFTQNSLSCDNSTFTPSVTATVTETLTETATETITETPTETETQTSTFTETPTPTYPTVSYSMEDLNSCPGGVNYNWIDTSVDGTPVTLGDDDFIEVALPFTFTFAGVERSSVFISSNGFLSFSADGANYSVGNNIPNIDLPNDFIAAFSKDLDPGSGGEIRYFTTSDSSRKFIVEWNDINDYNGSFPQTFEIILEESTNTIHFQYKTVDPTHANEAIVGIEYNGGTGGLQYMNTVSDGLALAFQLIPFTCDSTYTPTETATITETPTETVTETATATFPAVSYTMEDLNSCPGGVNFNWIDTSVDGTPVTLADNDHIEVVLPFTFTFAGVERSSVFISSNGFLTFSAAGADSTDLVLPIPNSTPPYEFIAALGYDLVPPDGGSIRYMVTNDSPRKFVVEWNGIPDIFEQSPQTFEIALEETTDSIQFQYQTVVPSVASGAAVGIEYNGGTEGLESLTMVSDGLALAFQTSPFSCDSTSTPTETPTETLTVTETQLVTETATATETQTPAPFVIINLHSELDAEDQNNLNVEIGSGNSLTQNSTVKIKKGTVVVSEVIVPNSENMHELDWVDVVADIDLPTKKAVVANLGTAPGAAPTHSLFIPKALSDDLVVICPDALTLSAVSFNCTNRVIKSLSDGDVSLVTVSLQEFWKVDGLSGTGGLSGTLGDLDTPTATETSTETATPTETGTETATPTETSVDTFTPTETSVNTFPPTETSVNTSTPTETSVNTFTPTETSVNTFTPTESSVNTSTPTETSVNTFTPTETSVNTFTPTETSVNTFTPTETSVNTFTPTETPVNTSTPTETPVNTSTPTET
ncbi:MAG: LamG-like jellyroll fold domain-containing protein, partial [bacterium]